MARVDGGKGGGLGGGLGGGGLARGCASRVHPGMPGQVHKRGQGLPSEQDGQAESDDGEGLDHTVACLRARGTAGWHVGHRPYRVSS